MSTDHFHRKCHLAWACKRAGLFSGDPNRASDEEVIEAAFYLSERAIGHRREAERLREENRRLRWRVEDLEGELRRLKR